MTVESGAKKLPCNHIFHPNCLRTWFQRQQTCPTCRTDVLSMFYFFMYFFYYRIASSKKELYNIRCMNLSHFFV